MVLPQVSPALRQALERHRFSLQSQPEARHGGETVHVVLDNGGETLYAGHVEHHLGLWCAFAVVRGHGLFRADEVGRQESFEDALLTVLVSFTHVE